MALDVPSSPTSCQPLLVFARLAMSIRSASLLVSLWKQIVDIVIAVLFAEGWTLKAIVVVVKGQDEGVVASGEGKTGETGRLGGHVGPPGSRDVFVLAEACRMSIDSKRAGLL